jgi:hypothetical protein
MVTPPHIVFGVVSSAENCANAILKWLTKNSIHGRTDGSSSVSVPGQELVKDSDYDRRDVSGCLAIE